MSEVSLLIRKQEKKMSEILVKRTHFSQVEIERLFQIYRYLDIILLHLSVKGQYGEDERNGQELFQRFPPWRFQHDRWYLDGKVPLFLTVQCYNEIFDARIFKYFDTTSDGTITREEWIQGLNILLKGSLQVNLLPPQFFCFFVRTVICFCAGANPVHILYLRPQSWRFHQQRGDAASTQNCAIQVCYCCFSCSCPFSCTFSFS